MDITGRKLFVKAMMEEGVDTIFGYPGGMVTDLFDELYKQDDIHLVLPRHEQGLIHEAEGYARATGKPGVCLVTSGPGATNIITGLADAHFDSIPLVCITGQVPLPNNREIVSLSPHIPRLPRLQKSIAKDLFHVYTDSLSIPHL